jgi:hypothetical protein
MVAAGILLCYLAGCRTMSLFDTLVKIDYHCLIAEREANTSNNDEDIPADGLSPEDKMVLDTDDESDDSMLGEGTIVPSRTDVRTYVRKFKGDMNDSLDSDTDCSISSEVDDPDRFTDGSSVTDDNTARARKRLG